MSQNSHRVPLGYLFWIFGFTGAHRFYYGKKITGAIWFCTFGLLGIGWLIDFFLIPSMDRKADIKYKSGFYSYTIAWIFITFLGLFGVHRFYLGRWLSGLIYLFTGALLGMGLLYDYFHLNELIDESNRTSET